MAGLGLILEPFDGSNFGDYVDRLDSYFLANEVAQVAHDADEATKAAADKKKSAALVTLLGKSGFSTLKDLCLPNKPLSKSYTELCKLTTIPKRVWLRNRIDFTRQLKVRKRRRILLIS